MDNIYEGKQIRLVFDDYLMRVWKKTRIYACLKGTKLQNNMRDLGKLEMIQCKKKRFLDNINMIL